MVLPHINSLGPKRILPRMICFFFLIWMADYILQARIWIQTEEYEDEDPFTQNIDRVSTSNSFNFQGTNKDEKEKWNKMYKSINDYFHIRNASEKDPLLNLHKYEFSLRSKMCELYKPDIVIFVHTATGNNDRRQVIRNSWGRYYSLRNVSLVKLFMVGQTGNTKLQNHLEWESEIYDDIVQGNFHDSYRNLTYKHIMGLHWVLSKCPTAKLFAKVDDDVLVNVFNMVDYYKKWEHGETGIQSNFLYCNFLKRSPALRDPISKWFVTKEHFPFEIYPDFCSGMAYLMTPDVALSLHEASEDTRFFWVDDVYVTGILRQKVGLGLTTMKAGHSSTRMRSDNRRTINKFMFLLGTHLWRVLWKALLGFVENKP